LHTSKSEQDQNHCFVSIIFVPKNNYNLISKSAAHHSFIQCPYLICACQNNKCLVTKQSNSTVIHSIWHIILPWSQ
jgi:hypothetical protein